MEDEEIISRKSWNRNIEFVNKVGFRDGASDGQKSIYQSSFDSGFQQGFNFGYNIGYKKAILRLQSNLNSVQQTSIQLGLRDPRQINCQICLNVLTLQQNVGNLYNTQLEKNNEILSNTELIT